MLTQKSPKAPTISDVARQAGVSPYTVSVVLNGARSNTRVSEATRQRIMASAKALRYRANASARNLARQRTGTVGVLFGVVPSTTALANDYASAILEGVVRRAADCGYDVMLHTAPWRDAAHSAAHYSDQRTDGILIVAPTTDSDVLEGLSGIGFLPTVAISASPDRCGPLGVATADVDNAGGIALAIEHLVALGHTRIAHLMGNPNLYSVGVRRAAFVACLASHGQSVPDEYLIHTRYDATSVPESLRALMALPHPPTAIVAGNDKIAMAVLRTASEIGLRVPADLSVVGFDDIPAASLVTPALTTIRQPTVELGALAFDLLREQIAASASGTVSAPTDETATDDSVTAAPPQATPHRLLPPQLTVRGSTAAALPTD